MRGERLRQLSTWTTVTIAAAIVLLTLVVSPAEGDSLSRLFPGVLPFLGDGTTADACVGGIQCQDGHALAFLVLALSATIHATATRRHAARLWSIAGVFGLLLAFAAADEVAQGWAGRDPSMSDWAADAVGVALGIVLGSQLTRVLSRR